MSAGARIAGGLLSIGIALLVGCSGSQPPRALIAGGDGGGLARATPQAEHIDATALERAAQDPAAQGLQAFVVTRDAHIVFERYGAGVGADTVVDGGTFASAMLALTAAVAVSEGTLEPTALDRLAPYALRVALEAASGLHYPEYLSRHLWSRLNAHAAWIALPAAAAPPPVDCCLNAQVLDWVRVAMLLVDEGRFEGKQVIPAAAVQRLQRPKPLNPAHAFGVELAPAAEGAEPFATGGVYFVRGPQHWRIWLVPPLRLAVLFGAAGNTAMDETRLPNLVIRAVSDRPQEPGNLSDLQRIVPGH
jgi:CubicO group peptidase (beta-lactamase class C family)